MEPISRSDALEVMVRSLNKLYCQVEDPSDLNALVDAMMAILIQDQIIPPERRTRPVTKAEVAKLISPGRNTKASVRALNLAIFTGDFRCQRINRSRYYFDLADFCDEHQDQLRPTTKL